MSPVSGHCTACLCSQCFVTRELVPKPAPVSCPKCAELRNEITPLVLLVSELLESLANGYEPGDLPGLVQEAIAKVQGG